MFRAAILVILITFPGIAHAQSISGIINRYTAVSAIDTCLGMLQVSDTSGFKKGDAVLLIQMQGATISGNNNSSYGTIQSLQSAGLYERAILDSVGSGAFFLRNRLLNRYQPAGKVQAVRIATYQSVVVSDTVFALPWNGQTGGILALEVIDTLTLDAPLLADGAGFRGGAASVVPGNNCNFLIPENDYYYAAGNWRGSYKGEGIALPQPGKELGRGPQANGGGGGNDHNAGGGGGAHFSMGGLGGENDEPSAFGCDGYYPGIGGYALSTDPLRLFPGGGGGAGHANNTLEGSGGNGGGIILLNAGVITGNHPVISANGQSATTAEGDGGGGGGAGGSIRLQVQSDPYNLQISADGGKGGNTSNNNANRCFGPGGGGSGGRLLTNISGIQAPMGGQPGIVTNSINGCNGTSGGATAGADGFADSLPMLPESTLALRPEILVQPLSDTVCGVNVPFPALVSPGNWSLQWQYNTGNGWVNAQPGNLFANTQTETLLLPLVFFTHNGMLLRLRASRPGCFQVYSDSALVTAILPPAAAFNYTANGTVVSFENLSANANGFHWDFGDQQSGNEANPQHTYSTEGNYTVTLTAYNACDTVSSSQEINILFFPAAEFMAPDTVTNCGPVTVQLENQSSENSSSFQWLFPGGAPENSTEMNPEVMYGTSGNYIVTLIVSNAAGSDTSTQTIRVEIPDVPVAGFTYTALPDGVVEFVNTSAGTAGFTWDFGDDSPLVAADSVVSHTYNASGDYTITLVASNACGASVFQQTVHIETGSVGTEEAAKGLSIRLYPNPAGSYLVIDCSMLQSPPDQVAILDLTGRSVYFKQGFSEFKPFIDVRDLPAGAYLVQVRAEGRTITKMMVKL